MLLGRIAVALYLTSLYKERKEKTAENENYNIYNEQLKEELVLV